MARQHFATRAELERQMEAARQLRAESLGGTAWIIHAFAATARSVRRLMHLLAAYAPRRV